MSDQFEALAEVATALFPDEKSLFLGLDPVLAAYLSEQMEAQPALRGPLAVAAMGRIFGWADE